VFFDTAEPVLAFARGDAMLCIFNLSPQTAAVLVGGTGATALAESAEWRNGALTLGPNGFALLEVAGMPSVAEATPAQIDA
jgi:alpha-glucosidase